MFAYHTPSLGTNPHPGTVAMFGVIVLWGWREDQKFKDILSYYSTCRDSLGYMRPCLSNSNRNKTGQPEDAKVMLSDAEPGGGMLNGEREAEPFWHRRPSLANSPVLSGLCFYELCQPDSAKIKDDLHSEFLLICMQWTSGSDWSRRHFRCFTAAESDTQGRACKQDIICQRGLSLWKHFNR